MNVLVINCGSSSLKYQLIDSDTESSTGKRSVREDRNRRTACTYQPAGERKMITGSRHADPHRGNSDGSRRSGK